MLWCLNFEKVLELVRAALRLDFELVSDTFWSLACEGSTWKAKLHSSTCQIFHAPSWVLAVFGSSDQAFGGHLSLLRSQGASLLQPRDSL